MPCSNCYNGCTEIVSDKCVKYTGLDVPALGIQTGDSLSYVEQALIEFLTSTLDGTGIIPLLGDTAICNVIDKYLPDCEPITLNDVLIALIKGACDIQNQVSVLRGEMDTLNADYNISCLSGVTNSSDTHLVVQAVITKLCQLQIDLTALAIDVHTNYVKLSELDALIEDYINNQAPTEVKYYTKMIPYTAVEYYGDLSNFDVNGIGSGVWEKIYVCNGQNGTPDKRGVVPVGAIVGVPGTIPLDPKVDPAVDPIYNTAYFVGGPIVGTNRVTLTTTQIPAHTHAASSVVVEPNSGQGHRHDFIGVDTVSTAGGGSSTRQCGNFNKQTSYAPTGISVNTTNANTGGGGPHANNQPALACYYIMYIP